MKRERKIANVQSYVKKNISFSDMVKGNNPTYLPERIPESQVITSSNNPLASSINDIINMFKTQVMTLLQKQQEQITNLTRIVEKAEKKTDYVLNIIDSINLNNE